MGQSIRAMSHATAKERVFSISRHGFQNDQVQRPLQYFRLLCRLIVLLMEPLYLKVAHSG